jgi:hypothetical protein
MLQILNVDHLEYLVTFMRAKLDKLDCIIEEPDAEGPDIEEQTGPSLTTITMSGGLLVHFHLGSPEKEEKPISDLTGATKFSVLGIPRMLERFLNKSRTRDESYYKVQSGHMVSVCPSLACGMLIYIFMADQGIPLFAGQL